MQIREDAIAVSLTKGMRVRKDGPQLISQMITARLRVDCSVLMGANIAHDIGREELSEGTLGYTVAANADILTKLFSRPYYLVTPVPDVVRSAQPPACILIHSWHSRIHIPRSWLASWPWANKRPSVPIHVSPVLQTALPCHAIHARVHLTAL